MMAWSREVSALARALTVSALALLVPSAAAPRHASLNGLPEVVLWAWERPVDLRGLETSIGVAFLAQTIRVDGDDLAVEPRRQPLRVAPGARLMAVTRIETTSRAPVSPAMSTVPDLASLIRKTSDLSQVVALQVDFDAKASERDFYRTLLRALRQRVDDTVPLSITALASWCVGDPWLRDLPIDEAVPMLFRMGQVHEPFRAMATSPRSSDVACRGAVGVSLDEPLRVGRANRRLYVFSARPWTDVAIAEAIRQADQ